MTRFLLGESSAEERDRIEARLVGDPDYAEALWALDEELLVAHARGEGSRAMRQAVERDLSLSPMRRRQLDETLELVAALAPQRSAMVARPSGWRPWWIAAAAFGVGVAVTVAIALRGPLFRGAGTTGTAPSQKPAASQPSAAFAIFLAAGNPRADGTRQANVFRVPTAASVVKVTMLVAAGADDMEMSLRVVGGGIVMAAQRPTSRQTGQGIEVAATVPAALLRPGDYVLTLSGVSPNRVREDIASRFFSVVE